MKEILTWSVLLIFTLTCVGCSNKEYYAALEKQELTRQMSIAKRERERDYQRQQDKIERLKYEANITALRTAALNAAAKTTNSVDDTLLVALFAQQDSSRLIQELAVTFAESVREPEPEYKPNNIAPPKSGWDYAAEWLWPVAAIAGAYFFTDTINNAISSAGSAYNISGKSQYSSNSYNSDSYNDAGRDQWVSANDGVSSDIPTEGEDYLGIPGCSGEDSYYNCKCLSQPETCGG